MQGLAEQAAADRLDHRRNQRTTDLVPLALNMSQDAFISLATGAGTGTGVSLGSAMLPAAGTVLGGTGGGVLGGLLAVAGSRALAPAILGTLGREESVDQVFGPLQDDVMQVASSLTSLGADQAAEALGGGLVLKEITSLVASLSVELAPKIQDTYGPMLQAGRPLTEILGLVGEDVVVQAAQVLAVDKGMEFGAQAAGSLGGAALVKLAGMLGVDLAQWQQSLATSAGGLVEDSFVLGAQRGKIDVINGGGARTLQQSPLVGAEHPPSPSLVEDSFTINGRDVETSATPAPDTQPPTVAQIVEDQEGIAGDNTGDRLDDTPPSKKDAGGTSGDTVGGSQPKIQYALSADTARRQLTKTKAKLAKIGELVTKVERHHATVDKDVFDTPSRENAAAPDRSVQVSVPSEGGTIGDKVKRLFAAREDVLNESINLPSGARSKQYPTLRSFLASGTTQDKLIDLRVLKDSRESLSARIVENEKTIELNERLYKEVNDLGRTPYSDTVEAEEHRKTIIEMGNEIENVNVENTDSLRLRREIVERAAKLLSTRHFLAIATGSRSDMSALSVETEKLTEMNNSLRQRLEVAEPADDDLSLSESALRALHTVKNSSDPAHQNYYKKVPKQIKDLLDAIDASPDGKPLGGALSSGFQPNFVSKDSLETIFDTQDIQVLGTAEHPIVALGNYFPGDDERAGADFATQTVLTLKDGRPPKTDTQGMQAYKEALRYFVNKIKTAVDVDAANREDMVFVGVPSSSAGKTNAVKDLLSQLGKGDYQVEPNLIINTKTRQAAHLGGARGLKEQLDSLVLTAVPDPDKTYVIVDDVLSSGRSAWAALQTLQQVSQEVHGKQPKVIVMVAGRSNRDYFSADQLGRAWSGRFKDLSSDEMKSFRGYWGGIFSDPKKLKHWAKTETERLQPEIDSLKATIEYYESRNQKNEGR